MNNLNGAEEPSMDEILASIRKIIADEAPESGLAPPPVQSEPATPAAASAAAAAPRTLGTNAGTNDAPSSLSARLNGVFGSLSGPALVVSQRSGAAARTAVDDDLSELFGEPSNDPVSIALPQISRAAATADQTKRPRPPDFDAMAAPAVIVPPRVTPATAPVVAAPVVEPAKPAPVVVAAAPAPAAAAIPSTLVTPQGIDFGRVARAAVAPVAQPAAIEPEPVTPLATPAPESKAAAAEATSGPVVLAAMPAWRPAPGAVVASMPDAPAAAAVPAAPVVSAATVVAATLAETVMAPEPAMTATLAILARAATDEPAQISPSARAIGLGTGPQTSEPMITADDPAAAAVASALGALAAGLAASARPANPEIVVPAADVAPGADGPSKSGSGGAAQPAADAVPNPSARTGVSVFTSPGAFVDGVALKPVESHALDDTAAELLRPMLRQWLDSNMPRIVEKALRNELAAHPLPLSGDKPKD